MLISPFDYGMHIMDTPGRYRGPLPADLRRPRRFHSSKYRRHQGAAECARRMARA
jgi:hypothetical protein